MYQIRLGPSYVKHGKRGTREISEWKLSCWRTCKEEHIKKTRRAVNGPVKRCQLFNRESLSLKQCWLVIHVYKHYVWQCVFWYHKQLIEIYSAYWLLSTYRKLVSWGLTQSENEVCHFSPFRMLCLPFPSINP